MSRRIGPACAGAVLTGLWVTLFAAGLGLITTSAAHAAPTPASSATIVPRATSTDTLGTVTIVVQRDDSRTVVRGVDFDEPSSGLDALLQSGLDVTTAETDFGSAVCAIEGVGCPADDCFCNPDKFWNYNH